MDASWLFPSVLVSLTMVTLFFSAIAVTGNADFRRSYPRRVRQGVVAEEKTAMTPRIMPEGYLIGSRQTERAVLFGLGDAPTTPAAQAKHSCWMDKQNPEWLLVLRWTGRKVRVLEWQECHGILRVDELTSV